MKEWIDVVPAHREILLALWNPESDTIKTARITLKARIVKKSTSYSVVNHTSGFNIQRTSGTGVNINYMVISPAGYSVIANRFPIFDEEPQTRGTFPPQEVIYVPYSTTL